MYCIKCGHVLPNQANYCPNCGWPVKGQDDFSEAESKPAQENFANVPKTTEEESKPVFNSSAGYTETFGNKFTACRVLAVVAAMFMILSLFITFISVEDLSGYKSYSMGEYLNTFIPNFETVYIIIYAVSVILFLVSIFVKSKGISIFGCLIGWLSLILWIVVFIIENGESQMFGFSFGFFLLIAGVLLETVAVFLEPADLENKTIKTDVVSGIEEPDFEKLPSDLDMLKTRDRNAEEDLDILSSAIDETNRVIKATRASCQRTTEAIEKFEKNRSERQAKGHSTENVDLNLQYEYRQLEKEKELMASNEAKCNQYKEKMWQYFEYRRALAHQKADILQKEATSENHRSDTAMEELHKSIDAEFDKIEESSGMGI